MLDLAQLLSVPQVQPQFDISPDGTSLAYTLDVDGSESYHPVIYDFATSRITIRAQTCNIGTSRTRVTQKKIMRDDITPRSIFFLTR